MSHEDVKRQFGRRVRFLRQGRGVSQEHFAQQIGLDRSYFGSIERGERNVSLENICLIAAGLGVPPSALLMFETAEANPRAAAAEPAPGESTGGGDS